jgi:hypothetical protein
MLCVLKGEQVDMVIRIVTLLEHRGSQPLTIRSYPQNTIPFGLLSKHVKNYNCIGITDKKFRPSH